MYIVISNYSPVTCLWQTLKLNRIPYEGEVQKATEQEYARRQAEAQKGSVNYAEDIEAVRATTSDIGGRLSRLEDIIGQLVRSIGDKNPKQDILSKAIGDRIDLQVDLRTDVPEDVRGEEHGTVDVLGDTGASGGQTEDVLQDVAEDDNVQSQNLVDNSADAFADDADKNNVGNDDIAPPPASEVPGKDTKHSEGDDKAPYSVVVQEVPTDQEVVVVDVTEHVRAQEVL